MATAARLAAGAALARNSRCLARCTLVYRTNPFSMDNYNKQSHLYCSWTNPIPPAKPPGRSPVPRFARCRQNQGNQNRSWGSYTSHVGV
jgi:hypothetical protein